MLELGTVLFRTRSLPQSVEFGVWVLVWEGPFQDQVFSAIISRIILQGPPQNSGFFQVLSAMYFN